MEFDPRRRIHEIRKTHRVTFGKAIVGERRHLVVDLVGNVAGDATLSHAVVQSFAQARHARP